MTRRIFIAGYLYFLRELFVCSLGLPLLPESLPKTLRSFSKADAVFLGE